VAHGVEDVLRGVHDVSQRREVKQARGALERVRGAEHRVEQLRVVWAAFDLQQAVDRVVEQFGALLEELVQQLAHDPALPVSASTTPTRSLAATGLCR
jgi:hypothetical protein